MNNHRRVNRLAYPQSSDHRTRSYNAALTAFLFLAISASALAQTKNTLTPGEIEIIDQDHYTLALEQDRAMAENGRYVHIPNFLVDNVDNTTYSVTEYVMPSGEAGYQTIISTPNHISSKGYGPEGPNRTYEIFFDIPIPAERISTSTGELWGE